MDSQTTTSSASSLGEELKRRREQRGITLRNISDETRINMRFLQAIESDNYRVLPGAVFNRRFVAAVAKPYVLEELTQAIDAPLTGNVLFGDSFRKLAS